MLWIITSPPTTLMDQDLVITPFSNSFNFPLSAAEIYLSHFYLKKTIVFTSHSISSLAFLFPFISEHFSGVVHYEPLW